MPNKLPMEDIESESMFRVIFVDPGLGGTGIAWWEEIERMPAGKKYIKPDYTKALTVPAKYKHWQQRCEWYWKEFNDFCESYDPEVIVMEFQDLWTNSDTSMAAGKKGDIFKLSFLTGGFIRTYVKEAERQYARAGLWYLTLPGDWKGQLSKVAVDRRIKRLIGKTYPNHVSDAVGMGLAYQGGI